MAKAAKKLNVEIVPVNVIVEAELVALETSRALKKQMAAEFKKLENAIKAKEESLIARLKAGASIQGSRTATIDSVLGACSPAYKELYVEVSGRLGIPEAQAIQSAQERYPAKSREVLVIGPRPAVTP